MDLAQILQKIMWLAIFGLVVMLAIRFTGKAAAKAASV